MRVKFINRHIATILKLVFWAFGVSIFTPLSVSMAVEREYSTTKCNRYVNPSSTGWKDGKRHVLVYLESSFSSGINACGGVRGEGGATTVTNNQVEYAVQSALEVWNQESVSDYFTYAGTLPTSDPDTACNTHNNIANGPAVFIHFDDECTRDLWGNCRSGLAFYASTSCSNVKAVRILGTDQDQACTIEPHTWEMNESVISKPSFKGVLIHELGHALGMAHSDGQNNDFDHTFRTDFSVMDSSGAWTHLQPYDRSCAEGAEINSGDTGGRKSTYQKVPYIYSNYSYSYSWGSLGHLISPVVQTEIAMRSGGSVRKSLTNDDTTYAVPTDQRFYDRTAPYDQYTFSMSSFISLASSLMRLDTPPVVYARFEELASDALQWVLFADWVGIPNNDSDEQLPPTVHYARSANFFTSLYKRALDSCDTGCDLVRSHISPSTTYDPLSGNTVYVVVDTASDNNGTSSVGLWKRSANGRIYVYPGHSLHFRLRTPEQIKRSNHLTTPNLSGGGFNYAFETDLPVGVACADPDDWTLGHNCMIAWHDRGSLNGRILYTYFHIQSDNTISWHSTVYVRGGTYTASGVDLGFFGGTFHMTFKEAGAIPGMVLMKKTSSGYSWSSSNQIRDPDAGHYFTSTPTFLYDSEFEALSNITTKAAAAIITQTYY